MRPQFNYSRCDRSPAGTARRRHQLLLGVERAKNTVCVFAGFVCVICGKFWFSVCDFRQETCVANTAVSSSTRHYRLVAPCVRCEAVSCSKTASEPTVKVTKQKKPARLIVPPDSSGASILKIPRKSRTNLTKFESSRAMSSIIRVSCCLLSWLLGLLIGYFFFLFAAATAAGRRTTSFSQLYDD
jgi:hypothetical protein